MTQPDPDPSTPPEPPTSPAPATASNEPISAYQPPVGYAPPPGAYQSPSAAGYPPPQSAYPPPHPGYGYPPQPGYGPPPPGYGSPQPGYGNPQSGYYPPVPGYFPPPVAPARTRNRRVLFAIGSGVLVIVLMCIGAGVFLVDRAATNISAATDDDAPIAPGYRGRPNPLASIEAQQFKAVGSDGSPLAIGQTLTAADSLGDKVRLTITTVKFQKKTCNAYSELTPGTGLLIAALTVEVDSGSFKPVEFDFALHSGSGAPVSAFQGMLAGCGKSLASTTQRAGTTQKVNLVFETRAEQGEIVYRPMLSGGPVGSWTVG